MMLKRVCGIMLALGLLVAASGARSEEATGFNTGLIPSPRILMPAGDVAAAIVLISDQAGWSDKEDAIAKSLVSKGALVIGVDLPAYLASLSKDEEDCTYMVSDIESLSQQVQRAAKNNDYRLPIIAGAGAGGSLALAIAAQTPAATIGRTLAVDPQAGIALAKELCTPATKETAGDRVIYGLTDGPLPDPITVTFTKAAPADGRAHVAALVAKHDDIAVTETNSDAWQALLDTLTDMVSASSGEDNPLGLPLTVLDATPTRDTMAVIYSGDGGWRDIDKQIGEVLQQEGMPVVGVDSLRYFWSERSPQDTADDLNRIIEFYRKRWTVKRVLLIGYSFGADVLPRTYNLLPEKARARVVQLTLLGMSRQVDYTISVLGWLGAKGDGKGGDPVSDLKTVDPALVQCIYGTDGEDEACPDIKASGAEVIGIEGGHHFDEDYPALVKRILDSFDRRIKANP